MNARVGVWRRLDTRPVGERASAVAGAYDDDSRVIQRDLNR
jgi:hypothetical protein